MEGVSLCSWSLGGMVPGVRKPWLRLAPQAVLLQSPSEPGAPLTGWLGGLSGGRAYQGTRILFPACGGLWGGCAGLCAACLCLHCCHLS